MVVMPQPAHVGHLLQTRVHDNPARPLLVWYSPTGERVELSAQTFANWVDKTVNLLGDLGWDEAPVVALPVLAERPGHWTSLVWAAAVWHLGGTIELAPEQADVVVLGPDNPRPHPGADTIACSLHPLGLGLPNLPDGVQDYHEVLAQPDVHTPATPPSPTVAAWVGSTTVSHADLLDEVEPQAGRTVVQASSDALDVVRRALLGPLLGGGSAVVVEGDLSPDQLRALADAENATLD